MTRIDPQTENPAIGHKNKHRYEGNASLQPLKDAPATPQSRVAVAAFIAIAAGVLLALVWDPNFVDKVIGEGIAHLFLGGVDVAGTGWLSVTAVATVTGLAGTFTACNVACFASLGPLAAAERGGRPSRWALVKRAAGQLGTLAVGQMIIAALYGAIVVLSAHSLPMLNDQTTTGLPPRLAQASIINTVLGIGLVIVAARYLAGRALRPGRTGLLIFGALLGLLQVGRPYPMFRELLEQAAKSGNILGASGLMILVVIGNILLLSIVFLGLIAAAGPALQRLTTQRPRLVLIISGALLLALGIFSIAYWALRIPARFGIGWWFPNT
jgi:hypothetical protein